MVSAGTTITTRFQNRHALGSSRAKQIQAGRSSGHSNGSVGHGMSASQDQSSNAMISFTARPLRPRNRADNDTLIALRSSYIRDAARRGGLSVTTRVHARD